LANKLGKLQTAFGEKCTNLGYKFGVIIDGQIEQQLFRGMTKFCLAKKVWLNRPKDAIATTTIKRKKSNVCCSAISMKSLILKKY